MKSLVKKSVSLLLAFVIIFSSAGTGLTGIFASAATDTVYKYNGISFTLDEEDNATVVSYSGDSYDVVIPETIRKNAFLTKKYTITSIGEHALPGDAVNVTIPSTVTSIGKYNFANNHSLQSVTFVDSPITVIDDYMFENCSQLTSITLPQNLEYIGVNAFGRSFLAQPARIELPSTVKTIEQAAFYGCQNLTEIVLNEGLTEIGPLAFANCSSLAEINIPSTVTDIGEGAFDSCQNLANVSLPENNNLKNICANSFNATAFYTNEANWVTEEPYGIKTFYLNNILLTVTGNNADGTYEIGSHVTNVASSFMQINGGNAIRFSVAPENEFLSADVWGVLYDKNRTELISFPTGSNIENYHIDSNITSIRPYAFFGSSFLKSVTFSNSSSVTEIGDFAFANCSALQFVHIPSSVQTIGEGIFNSNQNAYICSESESSLAKTYSDENGISFELCNGHSSSEVYGHFYYEIVGGEAYITGCKESFGGDLIIPETIDGYTVVSIDSISDQNTGNGSDFIYTVNIPKTVKNISEGAFSLCYAINKVVVDKNNPYYVSDNDGVLFNNDKTVLLYYPINGGSAVYTVPETVEKIAGYAFCESRLSDIYFPETLKIIGQRAFYSCINMNFVSFPESLAAIEQEAFYGCAINSTINIPKNVQSIGERAFNNCQNISGFFVDELNQFYSNDTCGVLYNKAKTVLIQAPCVPDYPAIEGLLNYTVPFDVEEICDGAFNWCSIIESIILPATLKRIGKNAFLECCNLQYIHIPTNLEDLVVDEDFSGMNFYICSESENGFAKTLAETCGLEFRTCNTHKPIYVKTVNSRQPDYYSRAYAMYDITTFGCPQQIQFINKETGETWILDRDYTTMYGELDKSSVVNICTYDENGHEADVGDEGKIYEDWRVSLDLPEGTYNVITLNIGLPEIWEPVEGSYEFTVTYSENPGIVFDANGGYFWLDDVSSQYGLSLEAGDEITYPEATYREGYIFAYWALDGERFNEVVFDGVSKTLEAVWIEESTEKYTVLTYIMNTQGDYELFSSECFEAENGETVSYTSNPVEGFSVNEEKSILSGEFVAGESLVLEVYIDRDVYTLYFENCNYEPVKYYADSIVAEPPQPYMEGYYFVGWFDAEGNPVEFPFVMPLHDVTIFAEWEVHYFSVTFDAGEGVFHDGTTKKTFNVPYGGEIPVPEDPTREGHIFVGWDGIIPPEMPSCDLCFNAVWETVTYEITFNANGGYFEDGMTEITEDYTYGEKVIFPEVFPYDTNLFYFVYWKDENGEMLPEDYYMPAKDHIVYAEWQPYMYDAVFDANGGYFEDGNIQKIYTLASGEAIPDPGIPQMEGYLFTGWSPEPPEYMENKPVFCYAQWESETYTVTFNANGGGFGNGADTVIYEVRYGDLIQFPEEPTKEGFSFNGWNTTYTVMPAENLVIDAEWTVNQYTVEWVTDDSSTEKATYNFNQEIVVPEAEEKTGYTFICWSEEPNGEKAEIPVYMPAKDLKYYAVYELSTYTLTYYAGNGFFNDGSNEKSFEFKYNSPITAFTEIPSAEGYSFKGWTPEPPSGNMPAENIDIYAAWDVNSYTVEWVLETDENGNITDSVTEEYEYEQTINHYPATKEGYILTGWEDKEKNPAPETMPSENLVLFPRWERETYTVKYYLNEDDRINGICFDEVNLFYEEIIPLPNDGIEVSREGFSFVEWKCVTENAEEVRIGDSIKDFDLEFVAEWAPNSYTVRWYIINVEEGACQLYATHDYRYGDKIYPPTVENEGFSYSPWSPEVPEYMPAHDLEFHANETRNTYTITFNANDGEFADGKKSVSSEIPFEGEIVVPKDPTLDGYTFVGWTPEVPQNMPAVDLTFEATWKVNSYNAIFNANGGVFEDYPEGTVINDTKDIIVVPTEYKKEIVSPASPVRENYSFIGWEPTVGIMDTTETKTFNAKWADCYYIVKTYTMNTLGKYELTETKYPATPGEYVDRSDLLNDVKDGLYAEETKSTCAGVVKADNSLVLKIYLGRNKYELTFDAGIGSFNDGTKIITDYYYHGSIMPDYVPYCTGYKFEGWNPDIEKTITKEETYTAKWKIKEYTITWNFEDEREPQIDTYVFNQDISVNDIPVHSAAPLGYYYVWYDAKLLTTVPSNMPDYDLEFFEILEPVPSEAYFNANGGLFSDNTSERLVTGCYGQEIPLPENPDREGYTFLGWYDEHTSEIYEVGSPVGFFKEYARLFTAEWEINSYTVTFLGNDGVFSDGKPSIEYVVEYNEPIPSPENPSLDYNSLKEWKCVTEGYEHLTIGDPMPAIDLVFVASWQTNEYKAVFDANGGIFPNGKKIEEFYVCYGEMIPLPEEPLRNGYIFSCWEPEVGIMDSAEGKTFSAQWIPNPEEEEALYSIEIYVMDVEGKYSSATQTLTYGLIGEYVSIEPTPATGFSVGEESVLSGIVEADGSLVLKIYYERNKYILHAVVDGEEKFSKEYYYEASAEEPEAPVNPGYHFYGWVDAQGKYVEFPFPMPAEDVFVYADTRDLGQWYPVLINITWMSDGELFDSTVEHYGEPITEPASNPYKKGYSFSKWECTTDSDIEVGDSAPYYDLEFNATFNPNPVTVIFYTEEDGKKTEVSRIETECNAWISPPEGYEKTGYSLIWEDSDGSKLPETVPCIDFAEDEEAIILEYYAKYEVKSYNVKWVDGNSVKTEEYAYGTVIKENKQTKPGYSLCWKDADGEIVKFTDNSPVMPANDVTFVAEWSENTYNAEFDANGGIFKDYSEETIINDTKNVITVPTLYNKKIVAPSAPEREGYLFKGWTPSVGIMDSTEGKIFKAEWAKLYTLEINYITPDGEVVAPQYTESLEKGSPYFKLNPDVTGYTCDNDYVEGIITENTVINIYYIANVHEIRFFIKTPDELLNGELHSYTYSYSDEIEMSIFPPSYNGYAFSGFEDENGNAVEIPETMPDNDIFVYVCYYAKTYSLQIDYVYSNGTKAAESLVDSVAFGEEYSYDSPEVEGYIPNFPVVTGTMPAKSVKHRVTYTVNGYNVYIVYNDETVETLAFDYGEEIVLDFDIPDIEGYTYSGTSEYPKTMPAHDITVYLEYTRNNYKLNISYLYSDKSEAAEPVSLDVPYGEEYDIDSPSISGFIPDLEEVSGKMGAENVNVTVTYKQIVSVTYDANGASGTPPTQPDVAKGEEITVQGAGDLYKIYSEDIDLNARPPLDVVLLLDSSGSMLESDPYDIRLNAARGYVETLTDVDRAAVIDFDDSVNILCNFTDSKETLSSSINRIDSDGGTKISNGISSAINLFENAENPAGTAEKIIILLTDGQSSYDSSLSLLAKSKGITVFTIGLGHGVKENLLKEIAETTDGQYFWIDDATDLPALFDLISKKTVTIRYEFAGWLASDENGELGVYEEGDKLEVNSNTVLLAIWIVPDEMYIAEWIFGSKCRKQIYYAKENPVYNGPEKITENGNVLTLVGWDINGDGKADFGPFDEMPPITQRTKYVAVYETEKTKITEIKLSAESLMLFVGETAELLEKIIPESADETDIIWSSTDSSVAWVDEYGTVTAKRPGSVIIRAENSDRTVTETCRVTVVEPQIVFIGINTLPEKLEYYVGEKLDSTGLTLEIVFSDGKTIIITDGFTCSPTILNVAGKRIITVDYNGSTCYFEVDVFKQSYDVTYTVDGTEYAKYTVVEGDAVPVPGVPQKTGHTFDGWCDENGQNVEIPDKMPGNELSFCAKWKVNKYTAEWYTGETLFNQKEYSYGEKILFDSVPEKEGHSFIGWTPEVPDTMPAENKTFHAKFEANTYNAEFFANGGAFADGTEKITVETAYNEAISVPAAPEKEGYVFAGWDISVPDAMPANDLVFTASWISADDTVYNIEMYYMDTTGQYSETPDSTVAREGTTDETVTADYTVPEGFAVEEAISVLSGTVAADGSLMLKVYFKRNLYSLTTVVDSKTETTEYLYGSILAAPAIPVKEGFSFVEWQNENGEAFDFSKLTTMPAYDIKVTAIFEISKYTVTYFVEGRQHASYEVEVGAEIPVPNKPVFFMNKVFVKWEPDILSVMPAEDLVYNAVIHTHSYEETVTKEPTCTEKGEKTKTCSCGKSQKSSIKALNHNWGPWQILKDATQYENGITVRICSRCNAYDYEDIPARNANFTVMPIEDQKFSSFGNRPSVEVYSLDGKKLNPLFNYKKEYKNNTQVGTASVFVTGRGEYYGQVRVDFNIVERNADGFVVTFPTVLYSDTVDGIDPIVKYEEVVLVKNKDYTVEYITDENGAQTSAVITGTGNFSGSQTIEIETVERTASFTATDIPDQEYTGKAITPEINVYDGDGTLLESTDYTVEYSNNIDVGFGQIVVTGAGDYSGTVTVPFRINGLDASELDVPVLPDGVYGEEAYSPDFNAYPITHNGKELIEGVDFDYYVDNSDSVGTAEIVITGKGNYSGRTVIYVNIKSPSINSAEIVLPADTLGYYKTMTLTVNTAPDYTSAKSIVWSTSDKKIATVDENGNVKAVGRGKVTITATVTDENGNTVSTSVEITCTMTFWQMIIAFFRRLFGIN